MVNILYNNLASLFARKNKHSDDMQLYAKTEYKNDWQFAYHYMMTHNGNGPRMGVHN